MNKRTIVIGVAAALVIAAAVSGVILARPRAEQFSANPAAAMTPAPALLAAETQSLQTIQSSFREVAKKVLPEVVEINVTATVTQQAPQVPLFPFFNQPGQNQAPQTFQENALGSGIIVRHIGDRYYVITNNHVVANATNVSVRLWDHQNFKATVVGTDPRKDLAMVSFTTNENIPVADLGNSNSLEVGDIVLAVGNPLGFESTVTMGIVSALGRQSPQSGVSQYTDYIQTDAAINQGNSGGALVNINGQVIGINTWIAAPSGGNVGLGFAIPINNAVPDINQFISSGKVSYGWLGVQITDIQDQTSYPDYAKDLGVQNTPGALVLNVYKDSPAGKSGILPGDYVVNVDKTPISGSDQLTQIVGGLQPGKTYPFEIIRYGKKMTVNVTITARDPNDTVAASKNLWPGMTVLDLTSQIRQEANNQGASIAPNAQGVVVVYLPDQSTPAAIAGFQIGDLITAINGKPVQNVLQYFQALNGAPRNVTFQLVRQGQDITVGLTK